MFLLVSEEVVIAEVFAIKFSHEMQARTQLELVRAGLATRRVSARIRVNPAKAARPFHQLLLYGNERPL